MKNIIKNITLCGLVAVGAGMGLSSCEDFLTITPTDRIVEEEFWQDKRDLNNAVMACYWRMASGDLLNKYIYWGEERSDNFDPSSSVSTTGPVANIMNANLLPTYEQFNWTPMYNAINYCNKVLAHGEDVIANDESFSENDWKPIRAEVTTLRALCHFYLVRTFGEVPYITIDFNNDSQELRTPQSTQLTVLNNIIDDLESVKDDAMLDYGNSTDNKSRVTRKMVHTLLADVYLWRASYKAGNNHPFTKVTLASNYAGEQTEEELKSRQEDYGTSAEEDYRKCIEYCDLVIERAKHERLEYLNRFGNALGTTTVSISDLLVSNETNGRITGTAYNQIFGSGNSEEAILELQIDGISSSNSMITSLFWNIKDSKVGTFTGSYLMQKDNITTSGPNNLEFTNPFTITDYRFWGTFRNSGSTQTTSDVIKYAATTISQKTSPYEQLRNNSEVKDGDVDQTLRSASNVNANWIVYRLSEIYLMKAEAMAQLYSDEDNLKEAFNYVREVFKRSNPYAYERSHSQASVKDSLMFTFFNTKENMESLIMTERQREFIGEGKRWYDLVRYALRRGGTADMLDMLTRKYSSTRGAVRAKLADMQSLYSPVYNSEIKNNNLLYQNGVWSVNETSSRTDDL